MAAGAMRTVKSAVSRRRQAEDCHNHGGNGDTAASAFTNSEGTGVASGAFHVVAPLDDLQAQPRHLAVTRPLPAAGPASMQAALTVQSVHINGTAVFDLISPTPAWPSRSDAAHDCRIRVPIASLLDRLASLASLLVVSMALSAS